MEREQKTFLVKANLDNNKMIGSGSVAGLLDRGKDVIYPGAWSRRGLLRDFVANGFVPDTHEWNWANMVGYPTAAKEVGNELQFEAVFHSTPFAQNVRTIMAERMDAGKSVGLSVGFLPDYEKGVHWFENGKELLQHAESVKCDMSLFDTKSIAACKTFCRGLSQMAELYEISPVPAPMNPAAGVTDVKTLLAKFKQKMQASGQSLDEADAFTLSTFLKSERLFEAFLRDAGFSRKEAVAITLHGFPGLQRDADERTEPTPAQEADSTPEPAISEPVVETDTAPVVDAQTPQENSPRFNALVRKLASLRDFAPRLGDENYDSQGASGSV